MAIFAHKEKDGTLNALVTGKVTREPEIRENSRGTVVKFSVAYGKKKYMTVESWEDSDVGAVAACIEKGDIVAVAGTYTSWEYNGKQYSRLTADMILPMQGAAVQVVPPPASRVELDEQDKAASGSFEDLYDDDSDLPFDCRVAPPVTKGEELVR